MGIRAIASTSNPVTDRFNVRGRTSRPFQGRFTSLVGQSSILVGYLPPRCRVIWSYLAQVTGAAVTGGTTTDASNQANGAALIHVPSVASATAAATAPGTGSLSNPTGTNGFLFAITTDTNSNSLFRGPPKLDTSVLCVNTATTPSPVFLVPSNTNSNRIIVNGSSGMQFGTQTTTTTNSVGTYDVSYWVEDFDETDVQ